MPPISIIGTIQELLPDLSAALKDPDIQSYLGQYGIALIGLIMASAVIYKASTDQKAMTDHFYQYMVFSILPAVIAMFIVSKALGSPITPSAGIFYTICFLVFIIAVYMFYQIMNPTSVRLMSTVLSLVGVLAAILALAVVYRLFYRYIMSLRGWGGFFAKLIFLLPCFVVDILQTLFTELKSAPKMVFVLLLLEAAVLAAYFNLPKLLKTWLANKSEIVLLEKPVFLSSKTTLGKGDLFAQDSMGGNMGDSIFPANYAISMWAYVNNHPSSNAAYAKETEIFRYGHPMVAVGHPRIAYHDNKWNFYFSSSGEGDKPDAALNIPTQAWNYIVLNYNGNVVDLFVNGSLETSVTLSAPPTYTATDVLTVGEGDNTIWGGGLHGAISQVIYHRKPLSQIDIAATYNMNKHKNPQVGVV